MRYIFLVFVFVLLLNHLFAMSPSTKNILRLVLSILLVLGHIAYYIYDYDYVKKLAVLFLLSMAGGLAAIRFLLPPEKPKVEANQEKR